MKILDIRKTFGPNVFHKEIVLVMSLDLENLVEIPSSSISGFTERLVTLLPTIQEHGCSLRRPGGFIERLHRGTYFGHIVEHVALELNSLFGGKATYGKTVFSGTPGVYRVAVRFEVEEAMRFALETAVQICGALAKGVASIDLSSIIAEGTSLYESYSLGPSTEALLIAARSKNIPSRIVTGSLLELGYGVYRKFLEAAMTNATSAVAVDLVSDKAATKEVLGEHSIPVPRGTVVRSEYDAVTFLESTGGPLVVKPLDGNHGRSITLNVMTVADMREAFERAQRVSSRVVIEEQIAGTDYRVLVVGGKVVAAAKRTPAHVVGDGTSTIEELIAKENKNSLRGRGHGCALTQIGIDEALIACLQKQHLQLSSVPEIGRHISLSWVANLSAGGTATDVTDLVDPEIKAVCIRAAEAVGLNICGVDLIAEDITQPASKQRIAVIELNASPGLRMHLHPSIGTPRNVAQDIIETLFPQGSPSRIPIVAITGTNGKTSVTRMIERVLTLQGRVAGMTTTDGIYIGGRCIEKGDTTGAISARAVLSNSNVEAAVLECARGGLVKRGLAFDWCDVAVMTNISEDHIGQDGIETLEDIVHIKSLVAERVRAGGTIVLNADDPNLVELSQTLRDADPSREIFYFSLNPSNPVVAAHIRDAGKACVFDGNDIFLLKNDSAFQIASIKNIPLTFNGTATFHVANCLAATAACLALNIEAEQIITGLSSFDRNEDNLGRTNLFKVKEKYLMLDYGHNPEAFSSVAQTVKAWNFKHVLGVIGVPGDRADSLIKLSAAVAADNFDELIVREDDDLRGREPGEVAQLLCSSIQSVNGVIKCTTILDEREAIRAAVTNSRADLVVVFYDELSHLESMLLELNAEPISIQDFVKNILTNNETEVGDFSKWQRNREDMVLNRDHKDAS